MELDACCHGDCFDISGPAHLMRKADDGSSRIIPIDWENKEHCRCVAACLVNGTYIIEQERTATAAGCRPRQQLAPPWWESFHFKLAAELKDEEDDDTFGAIFEHAPPPGTTSSAPRYVVAFRGTMPTNPGDLYHVWKVVANSLPDTNRFHRAHEAVSGLLLAAGDGVWLTGHSLGASMALEVGRALMASEQGLNLPTILFNPPQVSWKPVLNMLPLREETKRKLAVAGDAARAMAAMFLTTESDAARAEELHRRLSRWTPELYVHEDDPICQGFIGYFERRLAAAAAAATAMQAQSFSLRGVLSSAVRGKEREQAQPLVLPSATLWRTRSETSSDVLRAHGIRQWWKEDAELKLISRQYSCP